MARNCKCRICKKSLKTDIAFKVTKNGKNFYYCTEEEYLDYSQKQNEEKENFTLIFRNIFNILGYNSKNLLINKEIGDLHKQYSYKEINGVLLLYIDFIKQALFRNNIDAEFCKIRYIFAVIRGNIADYVMQQEKLRKQKEESVKRVKIEEIEDLEVAEEIIFKTKSTTNFNDLF